MHVRQPNLLHVPAGAMACGVSTSTFAMPRCPVRVYADSRAQVSVACQGDFIAIFVPDSSNATLAIPLGYVLPSAEQVGLRACVRA